MFRQKDKGTEKWVVTQTEIQTAAVTVGGGG
jgi:hypothetical protein